eukprot:GFUD01020672.1.p1 GENE.GFUD01020672.1~~GFUD01020672.1.p1  ORF type:complete len:434 (-),score=73.97 GFUD01020672.1:35-1336(-)
MGSGLSTSCPDMVDPMNSLTGVGAGTLVREIGMAILPVHLKHSCESIMQIVELVVKLRQFNEAPYNSHLIMLIALLRNTQIQLPAPEPVVQFRRDQVTIEGVPDQLADEDAGDHRARARFERDRVFGKYATNIFFASWQMSTAEVANTMEVDAEDVLFSWFNDDSEEHCPKSMILVDHSQSSVVLIIRGTFCFKDVLMDVVCEDAAFLDGFAHKGFIDGSRKVMDKCSKILEDALVDHFGYQLVICGHSMGGSVAMMITLELLRSNRYQVLPPGISVRCVALGSAPVYRTEGDLSAQYLEKIDIYINGTDVVPRLSLGSVAKLLAMLRAVDGLGLSLEDQLGVVMWREDEASESKRQRVKRALRDVRQNRFLYLQHPGHVTSLTTRGNSVEVKGEGVESARDIAANMEINETMITDHLHSAYRDTFRKRVFMI